MATLKEIQDANDKYTNPGKPISFTDIYKAFKKQLGTPYFPKISEEEKKRVSRGNYGKANQPNVDKYGQQVMTLEEKIKAYAPKDSRINSFIKDKSKTPITLSDNSAMPGVMAQYTQTGAKPLVTPINTTVPSDGSPMSGVMSQYTQTGAKPLVTPINTTSSVKKLTESDKLEIARKANAGIALTNPTFESQTYYDSIVNNNTLAGAGAGAVTGAGVGAGAGAGAGIQVVAPISTSDNAQAKLLEAEKQKTISDLGIVKNQALAQIGQQQSAIAPQFDAQRAQASTQSMQQARNFAEYLAARGQSTSGIAAQAELSRGSGLTRQLGNIGQQQQAAIQDVATRKSIIEQDYLGKIANATTQVELQKLQKDYSDAIKNEERAFQKQQTESNRAYQESLTASDRAYRESQIASQEPKYNYLTDPDFNQLYSSFVKSEFVNSEGTTTKLEPQKILDAIIASRVDYETRFGKAGYNALLSLARSKVSSAFTPNS